MKNATQLAVDLFKVSDNLILLLESCDGGDPHLPGLITVSDALCNAMSAAHALSSECESLRVENDRLKMSIELCQKN